MPTPRALPDDSVLIRERFVEGLTALQIAQRHHVADSTVYRAFVRMGRPFEEVDEPKFQFGLILPWEIQREHMALDAAIRLRAHIKARLGRELKPATMRRLTNWRKRLVDQGLVLSYDAEADSPWLYLPRRRQDGQLVIRWPEGSSPTDLQEDLLTLEEAEEPADQLVTLR